MHGDFSRLSHGFSDPFSGVLAQQGRLLLDAELNEQNAILLDYLRDLTTDLVGPFGGPAHRAGFEVEPVIKDGKCHAVRLGRGHYYVYGLRCQAPAPGQYGDEEIPIGEHEAPVVVFLVVWEQSVSALQAPELIDPALSSGVPDTTRRSQVKWRPLARRKLPVGDQDLTQLKPDEIIRAFHEFNADPTRKPTLGARAHSGGEPRPGPSTAPAPWGYRGVENQLYRVEVHHGGDTEEATFKWSRDNGSVEFGLEALSQPDDTGLRTATLQRVWYDARQGLEVGDWVELVDDRWAPVGTPAPLMQVQGVTLAKRQVTLQDTEISRAADSMLHPILRRWDQQPDTEAPCHGLPVRLAHREWFELEDGVQIRFEAPEARYERGDYWTIPARTATSGVLWPQSRDKSPAALPPEGPERYLAPLALIPQPPGKPVPLRVLFGHLAHEHEAAPEAGQSAMPRQQQQSDTATTAIRAVTAHYILRSVSTLEPGAVFPVMDGTVIGRGADAGIRIDHPDISRHHVAFQLAGTVLSVMDLGSTNGAEVNGSKLVPRVPVPLSPGDAIQVGPAELQFRVETS